MSKETVLAVAIHEIETVQNGKPKAIVSGSVFPIDQVNYGGLKKLGALRDPSDAEIALFEKTQPKTKAEPKTETKAKAEGAGEGAGEGGNADIV